MADIERMKGAAARAALERVPPGVLLGVGSGTTAEAFIDELAASQMDLEGVVPSSERTASLLQQAGLPVRELGVTSRVDLYVDGADEIDPQLRLLKGRGGALVREKVLATMTDRFIVIADETKRVDTLGRDSLPVEVTPAAMSFVAARLGGRAAVRARRERSDNGNVILDVTGLDLSDPVAAEVEIDSVPGVVGSGLFARRSADEVLLGTSSGLVELRRPHSEGG